MGSRDIDTDLKFHNMRPSWRNREWSIINLGLNLNSDCDSDHLSAKDTHINENGVSQKHMAFKLLKIYAKS